MSFRTFFVRLGLMKDPEETKRAAELKNKLQVVDDSLVQLQRKVTEASLRNVRNNQRLNRTMSEGSEPGRPKTAGA